MADWDVIVIGGGPAGSAAAITLAGGGARVLLLEEKRFPRDKLCGEFITPEAFPTLRRLDMLDRMLAAGAPQLTQVTLAAAGGRQVQTSIGEISGGADFALSLSRARFDHMLLERAREAGAECLEGVAVKGCLADGAGPRGVEATRLADGKTVSFTAPLVLDASGRNSRLMVGRRERVGGPRGARLYALKGHLENVPGIREQIELYFFPEGYGGLSRVEDGLVNLCFIANERTFRAAGGDSEKIIRRTIMRNRLAAERLAGFRVAGRWLATGPLTFGARRLGREGVLAVGDAAGMIDPFTGTGMQMALRAGELAAGAVLASPGAALDEYSRRYAQEFGRRMRVAGLLRGVAFAPAIANLAAGLFARWPPLARRVLRATRRSDA